MDLSGERAANSGPAIELSRRSVSFGAQPLNRTSARQTVLVRNVGGDTLSISSVSMGGRDSGQFGVAHDCSAVPAASDCTIFLTFRPTTAGSKSATLTIAHNADGSPSRILVSGVGSTLSLFVEGAVPAPSTLSELDVLKYVASYPDLIESIGTDVAKARAHYANFGFNEGRGISFEPLNYSASHGDLIESMAVDETKAVLHYLRQGYFERREVMFDPAMYVSLNPDLRPIAGTDSNSSVDDAATALARHYLTQGYFQGRPTAPEPVFLISRRALDFDTRAVNSGAVLQTITVRNSGVAKLAISGILVEGLDADAFSTSSDCVSLTTGSLCTINIAFQPSREGSHAANLRISHNGFGSPSRVELGGSGVGEPIVEVSRTSVAFLEQRLGIAAVEQSITVRNTGTTALSIARIAVTGADRGDFSVSSDCGATILRGSSCVLRVGFLPTSLGLKTATLTIEHNASGGSTVISLEGRGAAPLIQVGATSVDFGLQPVGIASAPRLVTVGNSGSAALNIDRISVSGSGGLQFSQVNDCGTSVGAGASCSINVRFTPASSGAKVATLLIEHDAAGATSAIALSGEGGGVPILAASASSLSFGNQLINTTSTAQTVTITNTGNANLTVSGVSVTGTDSAQFTQSNTCSAALAPNATCTISVTFTPGSTGSKGASLSITHNGTGSPSTVALSGTGTAPGISLSPSTLSFGNQLITTTSSAQTVTITNTGNANLTVSGVSVTGDHAAQFLQSNTCSAALAPNATCTISVTFTPASTGAKSASLSIVHNGTGSPSTVALSGTGTAPGISLSPSTLAFGNQLINTTSSAQTVTITNTGSASLSVSGVSVTGTDSVQFTQINTCSAALAPNATCTISVTFTPASTGAKSASLSIAHNGTGSPSTLALSGTGTAPGISLSPSTLSFGNQLINTTSRAQTVTITNTGNANLTVSGVSVTGDHAAQFAQSNTCSAALAPNATCTISVTFTPGSSGSKSASLSITHNGTSSPSTVALSGTGTAPGISLSPSTLSFGNQPINTTSTAQTVTITNTGTANLTVSGVSVIGDHAAQFAQTNTCSAALAPNTTCTISVTVTPGSTGSKSASLSITHNGTGSPSTVALSGTGTAPGLGIAPSTLAFGNQLINTTSGVQTVTITNTGNANLTVGGVSVTGDHAGQFAQSNTCSAALAPNATCTISVTFTPGSTGSKSASLSITHNGTGSPSTVALSGTGTAPGISLSPSTLAFGNQLINTTSSAQTVTITNTGNANLTVSGVSVTGDHAAQFLQSNTCSAALAPNATCTISVTFTPASTGAKSASLSIAHNGTGSPSTVALSGTGTAPGISLSPSTLAFGNQLVSTTSSAQTVTITNTGSASLSVSGVSVTGTDSVQFTQINTCSAALAPNATCAISVTFTPASTGAKSASLSITHNGTASPTSVALSGTGTAPGISLSPSTLSFGNQLINTTSTAQTVTITNTGSASLTVSGVSVTGDHAAQFAQTNTCSAALAPNATCTISVTFTPGSTGSKSASLSITHNGTASPTSVALSGTGTAPGISLSPSTLSFGNQLINTTSGVQTVTITNTGNANLTVSGVSVTGTDSAQFAQSNTCSAALAPNATCTISVTFTPGSTGSNGASLSITHNGTGSPSTVALSGTGTAPGISLSPSTLAFGNQLINTTSGVQTVTITNTGNANLTVSGVSVTGDHAAQFAQSNTCSAALAPNTTCSISVTFTPGSTGGKSASLSITHNGTASPTSVALSGTGTAPGISLSPSTLSFGNQPINTTSSAQAFTITNTGNANLTVSGVSVTGTDSAQFAQSNTCSAALAPNATCTISVTFTPGSTGSKSASLSITHNGTGSPSTVALSGTGTAPGISLSPSTLSFGNQLITTTSSAQTVTITNTGNANLTVSGVSVTGTDSAQFAQSNTCSAALAPNATCTISVTFTPASTGAKSANLSIAHNGTGSPSTVALSGTGTAPGISLSPSTLAFGNQLINTTSSAQTVTITNTGNANLTVSGVSVTGDHAAQFAQTNTCSAAIAPNATCTVSVTFTPTSTGGKIATLSIAHDATGSPHTVALSGVGTAPGISVSVPSITFGELMVDSTSAAQTITLSNPGTADLVFTGGGATAITITGANANQFARTTTCGASLAPSATCTVSATFTPTSTGEKTAAIAIAHSAVGSPTTVALSGTGMASYTIGGTVSGLGSTKSVVLRNSADSVTVAANGAFTFPTAVISGGSYAVTVQTHPEGQTCTVAANGSGSNLSANVTNVQVNCVNGAPPSNSEPNSDDQRADTSETEVIALELSDDTSLGGSGALTSGADAPCGEACSSAETSIESSAMDDLSGSTYTLLRRATDLRNEQQRWTVHYRSAAGALLAHTDLPDTAAVLWRGPGITNTTMPSNAWLRLCGSRVWTVQDGYELLIQATDLTLSDVRRYSPLSEDSASASLIKDLRCTANGGLRIDGYLFGVGEFDPPLYSTPVTVRRVKIEVDRAGQIVEKSWSDDEFDVSAYCRAPSSEQITYCEAARRALGW